MVKDGLEAGQLKLVQLGHETGFSPIYHVAAAVVYTSIETLYQTLTDRHSLVHRTLLCPVYRSCMQH